MIFGPFERAVSSRNYGGLGLGLFIAQQIAAAHGGAVQVDSGSDRTRFLVEIPRTPPMTEDTGTFRLET